MNLMQAGAWCFAFVSGIALAPVDSFSTTTTPKSKKRPRIPILEYHDGWVCVDKPSGITVHRGNGTPKHTAVLTSRVKKQLARKVFPVHRLDHRTSGAMLFAFHSEMAGVLHDAAIRKGRKRYVALVRGEWNPETNIYFKTNDNGNKDGDDRKNDCEEDSESPGSVVFVDKPLEVKGITKDALTKFTLLGTTRGETSNDRCSLLLCEPLTGRTHQIRRHAYAMGHPIIGDSQHGDNAFNRWWRKNRSLNRLALHCWTIDFELGGTFHECMAPLPSGLGSVFERLPLWDESIAREPKLALGPVDKVDGTHGRGYQKLRTSDEETQRDREDR